MLTAGFTSSSSAAPTRVFLGPFRKGTKLLSLGIFAALFDPATDAYFTGAVALFYGKPTESEAGFSSGEQQIVPNLMLGGSPVIRIPDGGAFVNLNHVLERSAYVGVQVAGGTAAVNGLVTIDVEYPDHAQ